GGDDALVLRAEHDRRTELEMASCRGGERQTDERVVGMRIALGQLAAGGERRLAAERNVRVLRDEQRIKTAILERPRELGDVDAVVDREVESTDTHCDPPRWM